MDIKLSVLYGWQCVWNFLMAGTKRAQSSSYCATCLPQIPHGQLCPVTELWLTQEANSITILGMVCSAYCWTEMFDMKHISMHLCQWSTSFGCWPKWSTGTYIPFWKLCKHILNDSSHSEMCFIPNSTYKRSMVHTTTANIQPWR